MSDNYRALTRTYRPRSFGDIVSQTHVSNTLKNAIKQNRLAHAYMFCGPRGVGKTTMARVLARTVNGIDREVDGESLNRTLNVVEIDAASNNSVDDIRDLRERVRIPPQNGRYKIYIIDEVHMLSKAAFNALLKTLEEPPDHIIFIFATTEPHKVLPTILSRVQRFDFKRISVDEIVERLREVGENENISIDDESLHVIAKKADGALRDALGLMDQAIAFCGTDIRHEELLRALNVVSTDRMFQFMEAVEQHDAANGLELIDELLQEGYDIQEYLVGLTEHLRNLYVARKSDKMHLVEASKETKQRYRKAAKAFSEDDLMRMLHIVSEAQYKIKEAHQPKIHFEITLLKLIHMERTENLNRLIDKLEDLKKKLHNRPVTTDGNGARQNGTPGTHAQHSGRNGSPAADNQEESEKQAGEIRTEPDEPETADGQADVREEGGEYEYASPQNEEERTGESETDDDYSNLFGKSSLSGDEDTEGVGEPASPVTEVGLSEKQNEKRAPKHVSIEEIEAQWDTYVESLKKHVPQMLYFQMQRVDPVGVKKGSLTVRCNDDFAKKIVEENKRELGKRLEGIVGAFLTFTCVVQKEKTDPEESMSPYERFKLLQKRDPKIKMLVELFGAELDYNLNQ